MYSQNNSIHQNKNESGRSLRNIFAWTLYDYGNAVVMIVFYVYFANWLVHDMGVSDFWYNMLYSFGTLLLLVTAPVFGTRADMLGLTNTYMKRVSVLMLISFVGVIYAVVALKSAFVAALA